MQISEEAMAMHAQREVDAEMVDAERGVDDPYEQVNLNELQHSTMIDADPHMPREVVHAAIAGEGNADVGRHGGASTLYFDLQHNANATLHMHRERGIEPRAFVLCFPTGKNHWNCARSVSIERLSMYFRQRILNRDKRFQNPLYMGWACSTLQYNQLCSAADVALRQRRGPATTGEVRLALQGGEAGLQAVEHCWAFMRNIRGTASYWNAAKSDLFAMIRSLGPPTWFLTLSADDLGWDDLAIALSKRSFRNLDEQKAFLAGLTKEQRRQMMLNNQVTTARHFANRLKHFWHWMTESVDKPLGDLVDWFWRIEFQCRGSPHCHSVLWCSDAPNMRSDVGLSEVPEYLDNYISTRIPPPNTGAIDIEDLRELVKKQIHHHTSTCVRRDSVNSRNMPYCRFNMPKPQCQQTRLRLPTDRGLRQSDFYVTQRGPNDTMVNPYNAEILLRWRANMDIQLIGSLDTSDEGSAHACGEYVCSYMTKGEPEQIQRAVHEGLARLPDNSGQKQRLSRIGTSLLRLREHSLQECAYLLCGLPMKGCSRKIVRLSVGYP